MGWHDESCRKADIVFFGDGRCCLGCGAVAPECSAALLPPIRQLADIRILSLQFGRSSDPVVCDVFTQDLPSHPEYEAVSYTWADESGDATRSRTIQVSGKPFPVTVNCENALRRARRRFTNRNIWIDAVCIDQDNVEERGHQVRLMPRIYAGAKHVLIYVGEATDQSAAALASVTHGPIQWRPFLEIMSRRYFTRAWTLQEVALARKVTLLCGQDSIAWALLAQSIRTITPATFDPPQTQEILLMLPPQLSFDYTMYSSPGRLLTLLDLGRRSQAADPRDKIFSLLGLMPGGRMGDIEADYNMDICQLYTRVAEYLASQHGWFAVLARAGASNSSLTSLPSWVPDWSHKLSIPPLELSRLSFYPHVHATRDTNGKGLIIRLLIPGLQHFDTREIGWTTLSKINVHWDSYVAQRTQTHLWGSSITTSLRHISTSCLDFLTHLMNATGLAVDRNTGPSIISHEMGSVELKMKRSAASSEPGWAECGFRCVLQLFATQPLCGVQIATAAQIFTMTIGEMVRLDLFRQFGVFPTIPKGLEGPIESLEEHASYQRFLEAVLSNGRAKVASGVPIDPVLRNVWSTKYHAGELVGVEARNQSSLRIISFVGEGSKAGPTYTTVTPAEMEGGLWSTRHPLFAEANEILWKLFLHRYLYREEAITIC